MDCAAYGEARLLENCSGSCGEECPHVLGDAAAWRGVSNADLNEHAEYRLKSAVKTGEVKVNTAA
jgi:hypothetical protein